MGVGKEAVNRRPLEGLRPWVLFPVGFGYRPTEVERVNFLKQKNDGSILQIDEEMIPEIDVYKHHPSDLAPDDEYSSEKLFFARRRNQDGELLKTPNGGVWSEIGEEKVIIRDGPPGSPTIVKRRTLVFHQHGQDSIFPWAVREYTEFNAQQDSGYVLCRLFKHAGEALLFPTTTPPSTVPVEAETLIANIGSDNEIYQWAVSKSSIFDDEDEDDYYNQPGEQQGGLISEHGSFL